jgi:hypothetical protein
LNSELYPMSESLPHPENPAGVKAGEPAVPAPSAEQPIAYKPISGWAIAGCAAGGLFALLVAICTIVALTQGAPFFFRMWVFSLAVAGVILSLIGQRHVQNSDGTRAGATLATIGLWLSLISGLGYFSFYYVTGLAIESQANAFVMEKSDADSGFFPRLRDSNDEPVQMNIAFLLARPVTDRGRARPDDEKAFRLSYDMSKPDGTPGELTQFREHPFARILFKESAKDAEITPLAVQNWSYEQRMYKVFRNYRIKTRELDIEFHVAVCGTEAESAGQGRKWFVNLRETGVVSRTLTPFGEGIGRLRLLARSKLNEWAAKPGEGPFKNITAKDQSAWDRLVPDPSQRKDRRAKIEELCAGADRLPDFRVFGRDDEVGRWEDAGGKIRLYIGMRFFLPKRPGGIPAHTVDGYAVLEPVQDVNPEHFNDTSAPPEWNLVRVVFTAIAPVAEKKSAKGPSN